MAIIITVIICITVIFAIALLCDDGIKIKYHAVIEHKADQPELTPDATAFIMQQQKLLDEEYKKQNEDANAVLAHLQSFMRDDSPAGEDNLL